MYRTSLELDFEYEKWEKLYNLLAGRFKGDYKFYSRIKHIQTGYLEKIKLLPKNRQDRIELKEDIRKRMLYNKRL